MANTTIKIKRSSATGISPVSLANGEIAINTFDGKLFYSDPTNTIKNITNQLTFGTINVASNLILATTTTDTLNIVAGNNVTLSACTATKTVTINASAGEKTTEFTTSSTSEVTVDSFNASVYRSAKYEVQMTSGTQYHVIELRTLHDGANVWLAQYGEMYSNNSLGIFDSSISGGNLNLLFTPTYSVTTVKVYRNTLAV